MRLLRPCPNNYGRERRTVRLSASFWSFFHFPVSRRTNSGYHAENAAGATCGMLCGELLKAWQQSGATWKEAMDSVVGRGYALCAGRPCIGRCCPALCSVLPVGCGVLSAFLTDTLPLITNTLLMFISGICAMIWATLQEIVMDLCNICGVWCCL